MKRYETIIWDWNGTLLDDVNLCLGIVNELLFEYNLPPLTTDHYKDIFDIPVRLYYERAGLDFQKVDFNVVSKKFCSRFEDRLHLASLFPAATHVIETIRRQGSRQFLLSNTEHHSLRRMLKNFDLNDSFDEVQGRADILATGKANVGRELLLRFHIDPDKAVMIGDTAHDVEVARELEVDCLLVSSGHHSHARLSKLKHPLFESLESLSARFE